MLTTWGKARSGPHYHETKKEHLLTECVSSSDTPLPRNSSSSSLFENRNQSCHRQADLHVKVTGSVDFTVEYELTDALGQLKSNGKAPQQLGDSCCGKEQDVDLRKVVPEKSPEQLLEDSLHQEQLNHHKNVRWLGCLIFFAVLAVGGTMMALDHDFQLHSNMGTFSHLSHFVMLAIVCCPPLWLVWEGHTRNRQLDQMSTTTLANKPTFHMASNNPQPYTAPTFLEP